jgi:CPA2 family monovalent cation:H+ antiporter-2
VRDRAALGIAYGSSVLFGASFALGAFFAGMVLRESDLSYRAAQESLPLRDAFSVLFFVSVGMLFDPAVVLTRPLEVLAVVTVILVGKSVAAFLLVITFRYPLNTALTVSASLAQIGEFSFILAGLGVTLGLLPVEGQNYILAGAIISIALNPIVFRTIEPAERWLKGRAGWSAGSHAAGSAGGTAGRNDGAWSRGSRRARGLRTGGSPYRSGAHRAGAAIRGG